MADFAQFQGLSDAIKLKGAMDDVAHHGSEDSGSSQRTAWEMAGIRTLGMNSGQIEKIMLPIFTQSNDIFAQNFIKKDNHAAIITATVKEGAIIEYQSEAGSSYGMVVEPPPFASRQGVYVHTLSKEEVTDLHLSQPEVRHYNLKPKDTKELPQQEEALPKAVSRSVTIGGRARQIFVEGIEKIVFWVQTIIADYAKLIKKALILFMLATLITILLAFSILYGWSFLAR